MIAEALTWQRTPFDFGQCVKGAGVDCGRFLAGSFNGAGVKQIDIAKLPQLSPQWFLHKPQPGRRSFMDIIKMFATEYFLPPFPTPGKDGAPAFWKARPEPADIVIARVGWDWAHSAIVIQWPKVIAAACEHCVTVWENIFRSPQYMNRELKVFDPFLNTKDTKEKRDSQDTAEGGGATRAM